MAESELGNPSAPELPRGDSSGRHPKWSRQETRTYLRFRIDDASANLSMKGFLTSLGLGRANKARAAINLSEGGVLLLVRELIPTGTKVTVRIEMEKYSDFIEATGEVRWCEQSARSDKDYYAGIQFLGLGPGDLRKIGQMREWFTSSEYRTRTAARRRSEPPGLETQA